MNFRHHCSAFFREITFSFFDESYVIVLASFFSDALVDTVAVSIGNKLGLLLKGGCKPYS